MPRGIVFVRSQTLDEEKLPPEKFCDWYENTHIEEVTALSGVTGAVRYEKLNDVTAIGPEMPYLTVYEMPDAGFTETAEFKGLDGQSRPSEETLNGIFKLAKFETSFATLVSEDVVEGAPQGELSKPPSVQSSPAYIIFARGKLVAVNAISPFEARIRQEGRLLTVLAQSSQARHDGWCTPPAARRTRARAQPSASPSSF
jgi:hypothetical protein